MDRAMRRSDRAMEPADAMELLRSGEYGVLSTSEEDGTPYGVPLSYVVDGGYIYFHCALEGRKVDCLSKRPVVSFCVVGKTRPVYDRDFTTCYESVIVRGEAAPVEDDAEKRRALSALCMRYLPDYAERIEASIEASFHRTAVYRIIIGAVSGKHRKRM